MTTLRHIGAPIRTFTTSDGLRIAFCIDDFSDPWSAPVPVVMLHSAMSSMRRLYAMVPALARHHPVIRMDLRGHGESEVPPTHSALTLARLTQDLLELLDHLRIERAHLLGVSGGGYLAQRLAIEQPQRVASLLLFASRPGFKEGNGAAWIPEMERRGLRRFIADTLDERLPIAHLEPAHIEWFLDEIDRNDPAFVRRFVLYMTTQYWMQDLAVIRCPTLIVSPQGDAIGNADAYETMERLIEGSERIVYDASNHNITDYLPDRCAADALDFLRRRCGDPTGH